MSAAPVTKRDVALHVWERCLHLPYRWGGDDPMEGFDCSGLVILGLQAAGVFPGRHGADATADSLLNEFFRDKPHLAPHLLRPGCLLFWQRGSRIGHVEIVWTILLDDAGNRTVITIGAAGGGSRTTDEEAASSQNAFVKVHPAAPGWFAAIDPF